MKPAETGKSYDKIADWWQAYHKDSDYGMAQIRRAISYCKNKGVALDVGCGSGGRITSELLREGFEVTGLDVSKKMIELALEQHPEVTFMVQDICSWEPIRTYNLIIAWDSIFHVPLAEQPAVVAKLCNALQPDGILIYTFGDATGEHTSEWLNDTFYYSSIGITQNLRVILENNCQPRHLEFDQFPQNHVYLIAQITSKI
ncbi:class I SAM-dependent methyltransferase [Pontibacter arcticus]|uniref:Class I SAM-dependent methyltransferase n=1 Tax=Pontibacter arcticus TaxID=2080288 RepID=A0A364REN6_9BACT|nr:class I SAM-dependent methyltransferase [Pontibacter arcticus]RAU82808.1 class I SAM-dependent methyltransferase [Pontibacter arcticus]